MSQQTDKFLGRWLVTEYVFNPDGQFAGLIRQRRELHQLANGQIEVRQHCEPEPALYDHPMARFAGMWVFTLQPNGRLRHYHGPAVIGSGFVWDDGVMTGRGLWPDFGYSFRSYGMMVTPQRQLTGGQFFLPGENVVIIIGVAEPEEAGQGYPTLNLGQFQPDSPYVGTDTRVTAAGQPQQTSTITRWVTGTPDCFYWQARTDDSSVSDLAFTVMPQRSYWHCVRQEWQGFGRRFGPALIAELYNPAGQSESTFDIFDEQSKSWLGLHFRYADEVLQGVSVIRLDASDK